MSLEKDHIVSKVSENLSPSQIALLLILSEGPAHAWRIKKILDDRGFEEWVDIKKSTIYKSLGTLEDANLIKGRKEKGNQLSRKIYEITNIGGRKLSEQIKHCIMNPSKQKTSFDLGLAGLYLIPKSVALSALKEHKRKTDFTIQWFEDKISEVKKSRVSYIIRALFERPYYSIVAQQKWLERFIQSIEEDKGNFEFKENF